MPYDRTKDSFRDASGSLSAPASRCVLVTPSDTEELSAYAKAFRVYVPTSVSGGVGAITVTPLKAASDADTVTLHLPPGVSVEPLSVRRIWATGTSAGVEIHAFIA